jgi:hypothetical protein
MGGWFNLDFFAGCLVGLYVIPPARRWLERRFRSRP